MRQGFRGISDFESLNLIMLFMSLRSRSTHAILVVLALVVLIAPLASARTKPKPPTPEEASAYILSHLQAAGGKSGGLVTTDVGTASSRTELTEVSLAPCNLSYLERTTTSVLLVSGTEMIYRQDRAVSVPLDNVITGGITTAESTITVRFLNPVSIPTKEQALRKGESGAWTDAGSRENTEASLETEISIRDSEYVRGIASALRLLVSTCGGERRSPF